MSVAPRRFRSAATSASICLRVESCCASVCVPPDGTGGGAGLSWRRNRRLRNFIWTPQSLPNDASAPLLAVYHTAISHSNLGDAQRDRSRRTALAPAPFHFRTGFAATTSRSSRNDPLAALLAANAMTWFVVAPLVLTAGAWYARRGWGGPINDFIVHYRVSGRSSVIRAPFVDTG